MARRIVFDAGTARSRYWLGRALWVEDIHPWDPARTVLLRVWACQYARAMEIVKNEGEIRKRFEEIQTTVYKYEQESAFEKAEAAMDALEVAKEMTQLLRILGDSHTARLRESWNLDNSKYLTSAMFFMYAG